MKSENKMAYKEWACVVDALAEGKFISDLRKGGIHEKKVEFSVEHHEFFLFPNRTHQREGDLLPEMQSYLKQSAAAEADEATVPIRHYVCVSNAIYLDDIEKVYALDGLHPFARPGVDMRFNYRTPGLWAVIQRIYTLPQTVSVENHRLYGGCRTWVPLQEAIPTAGAQPVLDDAAYEQKLEEILGKIKS